MSSSAARCSTSTTSVHAACCTYPRAPRRLEVGSVHINETSSSRVDLIPYGGTNDSGVGREGPQYAVREMSEERMVTIAVSQCGAEPPTLAKMITTPSGCMV